MAFWEAPLNVWEASEDCAARGGVLAAPRTEDEQRAASEAFAAIPADWCALSGRESCSALAQVRRAYIGLHDHTQASRPSPPPAPHLVHRFGPCCLRVALCA